MLTLLLLACDDGASPPAAPTRARTEAVMAAPKKEVAVDEFCEIHPAADQAPTFALPTVEGAVASEGGWRWVNVWATWCGPCIEEMPMLVKWQERLAKEGTAFALQFLSVDAKAEDVAKFKAAHPSSPPSMRLARFEDLAGWLTSVGLDASAVLPIHFFVDPEDRIRCVRMGGVTENDYGVVKKVLAGG